MGSCPFYRQDTKGPMESHVAKATKRWVSAGSPRWQGRAFQAKGTAQPQLGRPRAEYVQGVTGCASPPAQHSLCPFQGHAGWDKHWGVLKCRKLSRQVGCEESKATQDSCREQDSSQFQPAHPLMVAGGAGDPWHPAASGTKASNRENFTFSTSLQCDWFFYLLNLYININMYLGSFQQESAET